MSNNRFSIRVINALSYFSIFFLPVVFPLVVWVVSRSQNRSTSIRRNACKAFWSQIFPLLYLIFALLVYSINALRDFTTHAGALLGLLLTFAMLIALLLFIYNIAMGIHMLLGRGK